jgi:hypothetical protein
VLNKYYLDDNEERVGHVARIRERIRAYGVLVGNPEGNRLLGRFRRRWQNNINMDLKEIVWEGVDSRTNSILL